MNPNYLEIRIADEVMTLQGKAIVFADALPGSALLDRCAYFEQRFMAGRFHPNLYHPPLDRVRVKTRFGTAHKIMTENANQG